MNAAVLTTIEVSGQSAVPSGTGYRCRFLWFSLSSAISNNTHRYHMPPAAVSEEHPNSAQIVYVMTILTRPRCQTGYRKHTAREQHGHSMEHLV